MKARTIAPLFLATLSIGFAHSQDQGQPQIHVLVDGQELNFPNQQPIKTNGRVLVPLRGVFERLGAHVDWDPDHQTITAVRRDTRIRLVVGELDATVNNRIVHLDVPPNVIDGSTMVPLRFVSEALGENVDWNSFQNEVDITRGVDYQIPPPDHGHDIHRNPPVIQPRQPSQPPRVVQRTIVDIPADTVLPFRLNDRLTSYDAQVGDTFTATLMTDGQHRYMELPTGTQVYGHVSYVVRHEGPEPGLIEIRFDRMRTPNGTIIPVAGNLIGLDDPSVSRGPNGQFLAKTAVRNDRVVYTGYGPGPGIILGFHDRHAIADIDLRAWVHRSVTREVSHRVTSDVELVPGTQLGLQLRQDLTFPRGIH